MTTLRRLLPAAVIGAALLPLPANAAETEIGTVFLRDFWGAEGRLAGGTSEKLYYDSDVYSAETVTTPPGGGTAIRFLDGTKIQVGSNSTVVLDRFVYDPDTETGEAAISFGQGIFRFVSGSMNKDGYLLKTPTATLIVRGTVFDLFIDEANQAAVDVKKGDVGCLEAPESDCSTVKIGQGGVPSDPFVNRDVGGDGSGGSDTDTGEDTGDLDTGEETDGT